MMTRNCCKRLVSTRINTTFASLYLLGPYTEFRTTRKVSEHQPTSGRTLSVKSRKNIKIPKQCRVSSFDTCDRSECRKRSASLSFRGENTGSFNNPEDQDAYQRLANMAVRQWMDPHWPQIMPATSWGHTDHAVYALKRPHEHTGLWSVWRRSCTDEFLKVQGYR